ncbi:Heterokaryon incompatibility protein [Paramyrothecium foliicola]|nr:Heterokaryon incompatibility protein [Paramyrothecium foliicola]
MRAGVARLLEITTLVVAILASAATTLVLMHTSCYATICSEEHFSYETRLHVTIYFSFLALTLCILLLHAYSPPIQSFTSLHLAHQLPLVGKRLTLGGLLACFWVLTIAAGPIIYWYPTQWQFWGLRADPLDWISAKIQLTITGVTGHSADVLLGLLIIPVSRNSLLGHAFSLHQHTLLFVHKLVSYLFAIAAMSHGVTYLLYAFDGSSEGNVAREEAFATGNPTMTLTERLISEKLEPSYRPLLYYYLNFPTISRVQGHAFTAAVPSSNKSGPVFLLQRTTGKSQKKLDKEWTWKLGALVPDPRVDQRLEVRVEGPYPVGDSGYESASHVVCIVGGTGITGACSLAHWWLDTCSDNTRFTLVWTVRNRDSAKVREWAELEERAKSNGSLSLFSHVSSETGRLEPMSVLRQALCFDHGIDIARQEYGWVYSSGPDSLLNSTQRACVEVHKDIRKSIKGGTAERWTVQRLSWDIRLVTILPAEFNEPVRVQIMHSPLTLPIPRKKPEQLSLDEIRKSIPEGWLVYETSEGRVIFYDMEHDGLTSWKHPNPSFPREKYDPELTESTDGPFLGYEALSYTWGSDQDQETVTVEGQNGVSVLYVTPNLAEALRHLRNRDQPRVMWIDAICIDQTNVGERNVQVKRMGQIYALATRVVAWLGPGSASSSLAMTALEYIGRQIEITRDRFYISTPGCEQKDWCDFDKPLPYGPDFWEGLKEVTKRPWFERLWIIQEIHLASAQSIIKCGQDEVSWPLFRRAILTIHGKEEGVPEEVRDKLFMLHNVCMYANNRTFYEALYEFHDRKCADDKDKIYGLMNLAPAEISNAIPVDYSQPVIEAYKQAFYACARVEKRLGQLRFAGRRHKNPEPSNLWPSWVPIWSQSVNVTGHPNSGFCASGISPATWSSASPNQLILNGVFFGSVIGVSEAIEEDEEFLGASMLEKLDFQQRRYQQYPTGESYLDACLHVLALGHLRDRWPTVTQFPRLNSLRQSIMSLSTGHVADKHQDQNESAITDFFMQDVQGQHKGSRIFSILDKNKKRFIGIVDGKVQLGDQAFVFLGCDLPMILRPKSTGEYEIIGDCSVHGIMDGEAILGPLLSPWSVCIKTESEGLDVTYFFNSDTKLYSTKDPRLEDIPLPPNWESVDLERTPADPRHCLRFQNRATGEIINYDPRLSLEALKERGIEIDEVTLV